MAQPRILLVDDEESMIRFLSIISYPRESETK